MGIKPRGKVDYTELGFEAGVKAMLDAQVNYDEMDTGVACYCYGDSTCGQRVFYQFGMTQIPIYNVNNNCSTGSTGLHLGRTMISGGMADAVLVVGFEKMFPGSLQSFFNDRANPTGTTAEMMRATRGITNAPGAAQMFGNAGREYMEKYGAKLEDFAEIARVNHEHSKRNPYSQFQDEYSLEQVIDALGLSEHGKAHEYVRNKGITYGGKRVVNPSGGLISKGHPLGATGLAQCAELVWHLRGWANNRLVDGTTAALQHNLGLGGAVVVTVYKRADGKKCAPVSSEEIGKKNGLGYNPAVEAKGFTKAQVDKVLSKTAKSEWALQDTQQKVEARF